ncbi:hypothetical protein MMC10_007891 [Thelotrema lepadinum]|nr:hypothetical protein [Thelotrema lepadinum]
MIAEDAPQSASASASTSACTSNASDKPDLYPSKYAFIKEGWGGSRPNFQASYGLKMDPEGLEEGNRIIEGFMKQDREEGGKG